MKPTIQLFTLCLGLLLLAACSPVQQPAPASQPAASEEPVLEEPTLEESAEAPSLPAGVAAGLASQLGVAPDALAVVSVEAVDWPDACLGVTQAGEMCGQVITPGYRIVVEQDGRQVEYHTDSSGSFVRLAGDVQPQIDKGGLELSLARLVYAGPEEMGSEDTLRCATLEIVNTEARLVACDGAETTLPLPDDLAAAWKDFGERLASFEYEMPAEQLSFVGRGERAGAEWERALLAWARMTRAELASGKTSASARTALSWNLGLLADTPGVCAHLTVLDYGYAYAEQRACEGGDLVSSVEGWLEQEEMAQFDAWLYAYSPLYVGENYLNGAGATSMTDEEAAAVATWAQALWTRLSGLPLASADAAGVSMSAAGAACAAAEAGG